MKKRESISKKDIIYNSVFADIVRNVYDINSIITEKALIEKYNLSKSPVREALLQLCNDGILSSIPRLGYRITPLSVKDVLDATFFRNIIEEAAVELTCKTIKEAEIKELEIIYEKQKKLLGQRDPYAHWEMNMIFHTTLCSFSNNKYLTQTLQVLMKTCFRGATEYFNESFEHNLNREDSKHHAILIEALKKRDVEEVKRILKLDISNFQNDFLITT